MSGLVGPSGAQDATRTIPVGTLGHCSDAITHSSTISSMICVNITANTSGSVAPGP